MQNPKFSIITVTLNVEDTIEETILSVLNQSYKNIEYLIIDGRSKDKTLKIISKYREKIAYFVSEQDSGIYNAMNRGADKARGDYLYFLNSGDSLKNKDILKEVSERLDDNPDLLYGKVKVMDKNDEGGYIKGKKVYKIGLRLGGKVGQQAMFVKRKVFNELGGLNEKYKIAADFDLLCKILDNDFSVKRIDKVICNYDNNGISSNLRKSYDDTAKVIMDRYGIICFGIYFLITRLKLLTAKFLFKNK